MYTARFLLATITASAVLSGVTSADPISSLRKLEGHVGSEDPDDQLITVAESQVDSFFDEMKDLVKGLLGMDSDVSPEEIASIEETFEELLEEAEESVDEASEDSEDEVNPCAGSKPSTVEYFDNQACMIDGIVDVLEQAGANVTEGYQGDLDAGDRVPITQLYSEAGLCPVNVHWHLGAEHYSVGEYDCVENMHDDHRALEGHAKHCGPSDIHERRLAAGKVRQGFQCNVYDESDAKFTTPYEWKFCDKTMEVGQTYEVHWPHSAAGACGTKWQYQTPFYDGVFCTDGILSLDPLNTYEKIGVHAQVYTIVNDEEYYHDNMLAGMIDDGDFGADIVAYTGSTTGTTRDNEICSKYTPITWQVDRKCHLISASSFDKMCHDMMMQAADMSDDLYAHGSRPLVADNLAANNQVEGP